ncbi:uncharacterized protein LOC127718819 [Mytilus californianus]|uniref:uncharacterized protein LOC127718819 n=1 Tax=Mytilus californianus TaxID=6549 RepID=UPI0022471C93|nr:uncharacterized protein LOC127718819 [Mytilus californianus]
MRDGLLLVTTIFLQNELFFKFSQASNLLEISHSVCLKWMIKDEQLFLICKVSHPFLPVVIYKNHIQQARCVIIHEPVCTNSTSFIKSTNETVYTITKFDPEIVNGNWSCSHGSGGKNPKDSVQVNILCDDFSQVYAEVLASLFGAIVIASITKKCLKIIKKPEVNEGTTMRRDEDEEGIRFCATICKTEYSAKQILGIKVTICGLLLMGLFAMVIFFAEQQCFIENLSIKRSVCIGSGLVVGFTICVICMTMRKGDRIKTCTDTTNGEGVPLQMLKNRRNSL